MERRSNTGSWLRWAVLAAVLAAVLVWAGYAWLGRGPEAPEEPGEGQAIARGTGGAPRPVTETAARTRSDVLRDGGRPAAGAVGEAAGGAAPGGEAASAAEAGAQARGVASDPAAAWRGSGGATGERPATEDAKGRAPWLGGGTSGVAVEAGSEDAPVEPDTLADDEAPAADDPGSDAEPDPVEDLLGRESSDLVALEEEAAYAAENRELLSADELEWRIDERVKFVPEDHPLMGRAREAARRVVLADAALVEDLLSARYADDPGGRQAAQARAWLEALLPTWDDEYRVERLQGLAERIDP